MQYAGLTPHDQASVTGKLFLLTEFPNAGPRVFDVWKGCRAINADRHRIIYFQPTADEVEVIYIQPNKLVRQI